MTEVGAQARLPTRQGATAVVLIVLLVFSPVCKPTHLTSGFMNGLRFRAVGGQRDDFEAMNKLISATKHEPVIDRVFEFGEAPQAFAHLVRQSHLGKVVIRV